MNGLHSDGYAWKTGGRLSDAYTFAFTEEDRRTIHRGHGETEAESVSELTTSKWNNILKYAESNSRNTTAMWETDARWYARMKQKLNIVPSLFYKNTKVCGGQPAKVYD